MQGEVEMAVQGLPIKRVVILRPSLLLGERPQHRPGERIAGAVLRPLSPLMRGPLARYRPIQAQAVGAALVGLAREERPGVRVMESDQLADLAAYA